MEKMFRYHEASNVEANRNNFGYFMRSAAPARWSVFEGGHRFHFMANYLVGIYESKDTIPLRHISFGEMHDIKDAAKADQVRCLNILLVLSSLLPWVEYASSHNFLPLILSLLSLIHSHLTDLGTPCTPLPC
jgi:hypothetical protein